MDRFIFYGYVFILFPIALYINACSDMGPARTADPVDKCSPCVKDAIDRCAQNCQDITEL